MLLSLKQNTNRYLILDKKNKLPIIVDYDYDFSTVFETEDGARWMSNRGGYYIVFNRNGEIFSKGFSQ